MKQTADSTEELGVDKFAGALRKKTNDEVVRGYNSRKLYHMIHAKIDSLVKAARALQ